MEQPCGKDTGGIDEQDEEPPPFAESPQKLDAAAMNEVDLVADASKKIEHTTFHHAHAIDRKDYKERHKAAAQVTTDCRTVRYRSLHLQCCVEHKANQSKRSGEKLRPAHKPQLDLWFHASVGKANVERKDAVVPPAAPAQLVDHDYIR